MWCRENPALRWTTAADFMQKQTDERKRWYLYYWEQLAVSISPDEYFHGLTESKNQFLVQFVYPTQFLKKTIFFRILKSVLKIRKLNNGNYDLNVIWSDNKSKI